MSDESDTYEEPIVEKVVDVKPIKTEGKYTLVQYEKNGLLLRSSVLTSDLDENRIALSKLEKGTAYGLKWEDLELPQITAKDLANALRSRGIWTSADVQANASAVLNAIRNAYAPITKEILIFSQSGGRKK